MFNVQLFVEVVAVGNANVAETVCIVCGSLSQSGANVGIGAFIRSGQSLAQSIFSMMGAPMIGCCFEAKGHASVSQEKICLAQSV